ncbi:MAG TPA: metalloregulator ArsR/SmtB family transcription factor [Casimicrobiaceae bacterium]|nr:metalloregulator ArsR/SmtB family transcription factor [Casimicrobiaceae bacterium]
MLAGHLQLAALADPTRRAIFERVARKPMAVGEVAAGFAVSRPAVSQHLRVLEQADLVRHTRSGTRNVYQVNPRGLSALRQYIDAMWDRALGDFKTAAEASYQRERRSR